MVPTAPVYKQKVLLTSIISIIANSHRAAEIVMYKVLFAEAVNVLVLILSPKLQSLASTQANSIPDSYILRFIKTFSKLNIIISGFS